MASLQQPINTQGIDTTSEFDLIPEGWYQVIISDSDESENAKQNGRYIKLEFTIGNGKYTGKKVKTWLNYQHTTAKAQEIALKQLAKIMECLRVSSPLKDTAQLHSKALEIQIIQDGTYNAVNDYRPYQATVKDLYSQAKPAAQAPVDFSDLEPDWAKS